MTPHVLILVPVLKRPHRVVPLLDSIERSTPMPWDVLFIPDPDDDGEIEAIEQATQAFGERRVDYSCCEGGWATKLNHALRTDVAPRYFLGADDLEFQPGWLEAADALLSDTIGVVGTNDLCNPRVMSGEHATHFLVADWYARLGTADDPSVLLHEGYHHNFVDNEFIGTARHRNAYAFAEASHVKHLHPMNGTAENDEVYVKGQAGWTHDKRLARERQHLWT